MSDKRDNYAHSPHGSRLLIHPNGHVYTPGIDYETSNITVECRNKTTIVVRVPGHSAWDGNYCPRKYCPPELLVFKIVHRRQAGNVEELQVEGLIEISLARKKKEE